MTLHKHSTVDCAKHGMKSPAFVCKHIYEGNAVGLHQPDNPPDPEWPFENAWCDLCDQFMIDQGGWTDDAERFAGIQFICSGCLSDIKTEYNKLSAEQESAL